MEEIEDYKFGKPYTKKIAPEDAEKYATIFGEGSNELTELIKYCIINNIPTIASCKGHPEDRDIIERALETGYIAFKIDNDYEFATFLASPPLSIKGITSSIDYQIGPGKAITIYVPAQIKGIADKYFAAILTAIKKYKLQKDQGQTYTAPLIVQRIIEYIFSFPSNEAFKITNRNYKKYYLDGAYFKRIAKCPTYTKNNLLRRKLDEQMNAEKIDSFITSHKK